MREYTISRRDAKKMVGKGWSKILDRLYDAKPRSVYVTQVKEKWGGLRFYVGSASGEFFDLIDAAEEESYTICEECGEPGKLREDLGWILTLCDEHYEQRKRK
jgi:hypothetical protein